MRTMTPLAPLAAILTIALITMIAAPVAAQTCPELVGRWPYGPTGAAALDATGTVAYIGNGSILRIFSIADPANPSELGSIMVPGAIFAVTLDGTRIHVAHYWGVQVIDVSTPTTPFEVGAYAEGAFTVNDVALNTPYAYVAGAGSVTVYDVSDLNAPVQLGSLRTPRGAAAEIEVIGSYAYVADVDRLAVIDVSNPALPSLAAEAPTAGNTGDLVVSGNTAFVGDGIGGLYVIDVTDPLTPTQIGLFLPVSGFGPSAVAVSGTTAYLGETNSGFRVVDVSDPTQLTEIGYISILGGYFEDISPSAGIALMTGGTLGTKVIDVSAASAPSIVAEIGPHDRVLDVTAAGNYAYVAARNDGLKIVDISSPATPTEVARVDTPGTAEGVAVAGNYAYVADGVRGVRVIDVTVPSFPYEATWIPSNAVDVAVSGTHAYVADSLGTLRVVDITYPYFPSEIGQVDLAGTSSFAPKDLAVIGNYVYVAGGGPSLPRGVRAIDVTNPSVPIEISFYDLTFTGSASGIAVSGNLAFVAGGTQGLWILDISDPSALVEVGWLYTGGAVEKVAARGSIAYVQETAALLAVDVSAPSNPVELWRHDLADSSSSVFLDTSNIYVGEEDAGFSIFSQCPTSPSSEILSDGFESGDTSAWSSTAP